MIARRGPRCCGACLAALLLVGCEFGPDFERPAPPPATGYGPGAILAQTASAPVAGGETQHFVQGLDIPGQWWTLFRSPALNALVGDPKKVFEASYTQIWEAIRALVKRAIKSGDIRKDLDPIDLLRALIGVANVATSPDWQQSAKRLVDILITGSRPIK